MAELVESQVSRYQDYKPTGVEWMPEIPVGWEVMRGKDHLEILSGYPFDSKKFNPLDGFQLVRIRDIDVVSSSMKYDGEWIHQAAIDTGDILIGMDGDYNVAKWKGGPALMNQRVCCVRSSATVNKNFLYYLLPNPLQIINDLTYYTTVKHLSVNDLKELRFGLPSMEEQTAIVSFLDDKTAQLDQLITQKQQMLELLREERAALINHAVTKGLDAAAPLRDSGVEWLGEVPAHWEVKRLKHLLIKLEQGWSPSCESRPAELGEWGVLKAGCVNGLDFDPTENKALPSELTPLPEYEINPGDFLISRANTKELVGSAVVVGEVRPMLLLCDKIFRLFFRENANKEYVLLIISSWYGRLQIQSESSGASSSMQNISQEFLKNMLILLPDRHEQNAIVEYVAEQTSRILETSDTINQEIALLQEYRAALIAEAVTGQLDVRHYAPAVVSL